MTHRLATIHNVTDDRETHTATVSMVGQGC